ncbi:Ig-like domain-containing protein [Niallia sp. SS-2023]|uniref:S8 family peptidase n=1 Tax=Niallia sp. SS-2023 TaxID=3051155 RepID=UPI00255129E3|nr:Ig-like domain-containing protein [Niallia sp. SS-2023]MDL0437633.1 Ig-like domain-containing protein [Niallia sp. SS-2023]
MKSKKRIGSIFTFLLAFVLVVSNWTALPAAAASTADEADTGVSGKLIEDSFADGEYVKWFKFTPTAEDIKNFSHYEFTLDSTEEMNVSVYSSLENANAENTFDQYQGYSFIESPAVIHFPLAWIGSYYVKVEYYPYEEEVLEEEVSEEKLAEEELPEGEETEEAEPIEADTSFTLNVKGEVLEPSTETAEECPVELSTSEQKDGLSILKDLREIRDSILSQTDEGKKLSSLYYKVAPFLSAKIVFDEGMRSDVLKNLRQLKPIYTELLKNGTSSTYTFTSADVKAINSLYKYAYDAAPETLKEQLKKTEAKINISNLEDKTLSTVFNKLGASTTAISNKNTSNKYIVKLKSGKSLSTFKKSAQAAQSETIQGLNNSDKIADDLYVIDLGSEVKDNSYSTQQKNSIVNSVKKSSAVEYVEQIQTYKALGKTTNDVSNPYQWSLSNTGQTQGTSGADIQFGPLHSLLNVAKPSETVIAVIDTGVDSTLADLSSNVLASEGYNYIGNNNNALDDNGHGTHVSGIIAAGMDNGYSISGVHANAKILPVKVLDASGSGDTEQIAKGIKYAVDKGAKVINMSLGGPYSRTLEYMMQYAYNHNVTIVAATGNDGMEEVGYPASSKYATSVGATNDMDIVSDYSNYGIGTDLVAPGTNIPSLVPNGNVTYYSGTSMATPHVAAAAGLLLSVNSSLKPVQVEKILTETAKNIAFEEQDNPYKFEDIVEVITEDGEIIYEEGDSLPPGYDYVSGWGRLDVYGAYSTALLKATVADVYNSSYALKGTAESGTAVSVKIGKDVKKATADKNGNYAIEIPLQKTDSILEVTFEKTVNGTPAKATIRTAVLEDTTAPNAPKVNKVGDNDTKVTGTAEEFAAITVKAGKKSIGTGKADSKGKFSIKIAKQKMGTKLSITATDGAKLTSKAATITVGDSTPPAAPSVTGTISDKSTKIEGKAEANASIEIKDGKKAVASGKANSKGAYAITIKKQKAGTKLSITAKDKAGNVSKAKTITVADKTAPGAPSVSGTVGDNSTKITGKAEANASITIKDGKKTVASGKADSKGAYSIAIKKQKAGTKLSITAKDKAGNVSKAKTITVADKTAPKAPKVNNVTTATTQVKGSTEANATVTITVNKKAIASGKADKKGNYSIKIKKQKEKTVLAATAKDKAGNTSKVTEKTVTKAK